MRHLYPNKNFFNNLIEFILHFLRLSAHKRFPIEL